MDRAGALIKAGNLAAGRVRETNPGAFHPMCAGATFELAYDFDRLGRARRADRMAARDVIH